MHIDEQKKLDVRNIQRNIKNGIISQKDYEIYLAKLPDLSDKIFNSGEPLESEDIGSGRDSESQSRKKEAKRKTKAKGK